MLLRVSRKDFETLISHLEPPTGDPDPVLANNHHLADTDDVPVERRRPKVPSRLPADDVTMSGVGNHESGPAPDGFSTLPGARLIST